MALDAGPVWKRLLHAALSRQGNSKASTFVQLATVRQDGSPANRTVVYRGFLESSTRMVFYTDTRSSKVGEVAHCPLVEICWYMVDTWEQFRILGRAEVVDNQHSSPKLREVRQQSWQGLSTRQKQTWLGPTPGFPRPLPLLEGEKANRTGNETPGNELASAGANVKAESLGSGINKAQGKIVPPGSGGALAPANRGTQAELPADCFCLLVLSPSKVDYLSIKEDSRIVFALNTENSADLCEEAWTQEAVFP